MSVVCPCCKAGNDAGTTCRRCKADLSQLVAWQCQQASQRHAGVAALLAGDFAAAFRAYQALERKSGRP